jgi:lactoylglutathione lyase
MTRPFRILGIQQVALGAENRSELENLWVGLLGLHVHGEFRSENENVDEIIAVAGRGPFAVEVDLMQPIDPSRSPKVHVPSLNHLGLWVDDIHGAVEWLSAKGVRFAPGGIRKGAAGYDVCFIHPKGNEVSPIGGAGVLIELVQAPAHVIAAYEALAAN